MTSQPPSPDPFPENPYVPPVALAKGAPDQSGTGYEAYNLVADTVVGMNIRKSDNLFQLKVIAICMFLGTIVGAFVGGTLSDSGNRLVGTVAGGLGLGFAGVVLGLFGSGIYLMIYRAARHLQGKHD